MNLKPEWKAKDLILFIMVALYPLVVVPGPMDYFRGPRYIVLASVSVVALYQLLSEIISLKKQLYIPLALFLLFIFIATLLAEDPVMAWMGSSRRFTGFSTYIFCVILFLLATRKEKPGQILMPMIASAALVSVIGILQYLGLNIVPHEFLSGDVINTYSTLGNINWFGSYMVFILPAALLFYLYDKKKIWLVFSGIIYAGLLVSLTRGAWLTFFLSFTAILVVFCKQKKFNRNFVILIVAFALVTAVIAPLNDSMLIKRLFSIPEDVMVNVAAEENIFHDQPDRDNDSVFERLYIWKETGSIIKENYLFGLGPDHIRITMPSGRIEDKAHNIYLEIAAVMGIFALISYLVFLSFFLKRQKSETGFILLMMICTYLLQGFFNNDIIQIMPLFWITMGLLIASCSDPENAKNYFVERDNLLESKEKNKYLKFSPVAIVLSLAVAVFMLVVLYWLFYPTHKTVEIHGEGTYTGQLRGSTFHGYGTYESLNGAVYEGYFKRGYFDGFGTLTFINGSKYIGEFKEGYFHGQGLLMTSDGQITEGTWEKGRMVE